MVVTGLTLLFGGRADPGRVRANGRAGVEGRLVLPADSPVWERAADAGADPDDDGSLILARTVSAEGRSRAFLGGRSVPVGVVAELAEGLLAVHGQTDQLRLSRPAEQRRALDRYAGAGAPGAARPLPRAPTSAGASWPPTSSAAAARPASSPRPPTSSGTASRRSRPSRPSPARTRRSTPRPSGSATPTRCGPPPTRPAWRWSATSPVTSAAGEVPQDATAALAIAERALAASDDPALVLLAQDLADAVAVVSDVAGQLAGYVADLDADPARLAEVLDRRAAITALVRKYAGAGEGLAGVLAWAEDAARTAVRARRLRRGARGARRRARRRPRRGGRPGARRSRPAAAPRPTASPPRWARELAGLAMKSARVSFSHRQPPRRPGRRGHRRGRAAARRPSRAPRRGRCTRAPPAVSSRASCWPSRSSSPAPTRCRSWSSTRWTPASAVRRPGEIGRRLARLARDHQVVVVTHLAQVAAFADTHLVVDKSPDTGAGVTATDIRAVDGEDRVRELARMLSGLADSDTGQAHARELLAVAPPPAADRGRPGCGACHGRVSGGVPRSEPGVGGRRDVLLLGRRVGALRLLGLHAARAVPRPAALGARRASSSSAPVTPRRSPTSSRALPELRVRSFDISAPSVETARANIAARGVADRYTVELGDFFDQADAAGGPPVSTVISNPPYIPAPDRDILMPELWGGVHGNDLVLQLLKAGYDNVIAAVASYSDPVATVRTAEDLGYRVVNFLAMGLDFGAVQQRAEGPRPHPAALRRGARLGRRRRLHGRRRPVHPEPRRPRRPRRPAAARAAVDSIPG